MVVIDGYVLSWVCVRKERRQKQFLSWLFVSARDTAEVYHLPGAMNFGQSSADTQSPFLM